MEVARAGADFQVEGGNGFEIVIEHIGAGFDDLLKGAILFQEVRRQDFNCRGRCGSAGGADDPGKMLRTAVCQIIAVNRSNDGMGQPHAGDGIGHPFRLISFKGFRANPSSHCKRRKPWCRCRP